MIYDCFLSYQHEDIDFVRALVCELEKQGLHCWYAPRNVHGTYARAIAEGINHSLVFVLILNERSIVSRDVLNEVEMAHNVAKYSNYAQIQPVCTQPLDFNKSDFQEMMYYIRRIQFIEAYDTNDIPKISDDIIYSLHQILKVKKQRNQSLYTVQDIEDVRLKKQNELLDLFDKDTYSLVFKQYNRPMVLDVGCGTGDMIFTRFKKDQMSRYVGIDKSSRQIKTAKEKYGSNNCTFFEIDLESEYFSNQLCDDMKLVGIDKFDVINISMVLLHLKNPEKLLTELRRHLSPNGTIIIRDIDDGLNFAYPDPENAFDRIYEICENDEQSGNRKNGRQIYTYLYNAGFSNIKLINQGLSTDKMTVIQKGLLFEMYFPFILENARMMHEKNRWNKEYEEDYLWYKNIYNTIRENFLKQNFLFSLGFVVYTASF